MTDNPLPGRDNLDHFYAVTEHLNYDDQRTILNYIVGASSMHIQPDTWRRIVRTALEAHSKGVTR